MTIDEAIKIIGEHIDWCDKVKEVDTYNALTLGLEALKEIHRERIGEIPFIGEQLPGETKD